ncbi:hypothetical protein DFJ73DRAFT_898084, partial [Zopfochytrium polystomum]
MSPLVVQTGSAASAQPAAPPYMVPPSAWVDAGRLVIDLPSDKNAEAVWADPKLDALYKSNDPEKTRLLKLVRSGIPHSVRGKIYSKILKVDKMDDYDKNFEQALRRTHGASIPDDPLPPTFGGRTHKSELALTKEGSLVADHILCILAHDFPTLEYCPFITTLTYLLCHVMGSHDDALGAVVSIVKQAMNRDRINEAPAGGAPNSNSSSKPPSYRDWKYFPTFRKDTRFMQRAFGNLLARQNAKLHHRVAELQAAELEPIWSRWLTDLFVGALPQPAVWRVLDSFVVEGYRALFRVGIALLVCNKDPILKATALDQVLPLISATTTTTTTTITTTATTSAAAAVPQPDPQQSAEGLQAQQAAAAAAAWSMATPFATLFAAAWAVRMQQCDIRGGIHHHAALAAISQADDLHETQYKFQRGTPKMKDLPPLPGSAAAAAAAATTAAAGASLTTSGPAEAGGGGGGGGDGAGGERGGRPSSIMKDDYWIAVWSWIPPAMRVAELELVFASREHGYHISTLFQRTAGRKPMIMVVETPESVFGAYLPEAWPETDAQRGSFYGTGETFLFTLSPYAKLYPWIGR